MAKAAMLLCGVVGVVLLAGVTEAVSMCPTLKCAAIHPDCRVQSYIKWGGLLCVMCDQCIQHHNNECPPRPCPIIAIEPQCTGKKYFWWKVKWCRDCNVNMCSITE